MPSVETQMDAGLINLTILHAHASKDHTRRIQCRVLCSPTLCTPRKTFLPLGNCWTFAGFRRHSAPNSSEPGRVFTTWKTKATRPTACKPRNDFRVAVLSVLTIRPGKNLEWIKAGFRSFIRGATSRVMRKYASFRAKYRGQSNPREKHTHSHVGVDRGERPSSDSGDTQNRNNNNNNMVLTRS